MNVIVWSRQGGRRYRQWGSPIMTGLAWPSVGVPPAPPLVIVRRPYDPWSRFMLVGV